MKSKHTCKICGKSFEDFELISGHGIRHQIEKLIRLDHPDWTDYDVICKDDFEKYRINYMETLFAEHHEKFEYLNKDVLDSINQNDIMTAALQSTKNIKISTGDKIADKVASFGGSWTFIILFFLVLIVWIVINSSLILIRPFDPYPFILMNLILSCIAAIQAPIIMMSQNRQEKKDRVQSQNDYKINLKSELEIRTLQEKIDHLLLIQWPKHMNAQSIQLELLEDIKKELEKRRE